MRIRKYIYASLMLVLLSPNAASADSINTRNYNQPVQAQKEYHNNNYKTGNSGGRSYNANNNSDSNNGNGAGKSYSKQEQPSQDTESSIPKNNKPVNNNPQKLAGYHKARRHHIKHRAPKNKSTRGNFSVKVQQNHNRHVYKHYKLLQAGVVVITIAILFTFGYILWQMFFKPIKGKHALKK